MDYLTDVDAVLMDIEGTTTSISFVYDELFPYARDKVASFLNEHWQELESDSILDEFRAQSQSDISAGHEGAVAIPLTGTAQELQRAVCESVYWQMDNDRKTTGLKALQGKIWVDGYRTGQLKGHLFDDIRPALERFLSLGKALYIYSSGSVAAQKLLFGHSIEGDLTPMISGYFDTTTGPKKVDTSYTAIAEQLSLPPDRVLFLTDNLDEGVAARSSGMRVALSVRPGNHPLPETDFFLITSFTELFSDE